MEVGRLYFFMRALAVPSNRFLILILFALLSGCGNRMRPPEGLAGAVAPSAAVEDFLRFAGENNYRGMGWVFGTREGPLFRLYPAAEVERRMYGLASALRHDGFIVGNSNQVPGRGDGALRFDVVITRGSRNVRVPFIVVAGPERRWYVEQLDVEAVTGR